ncbi:type 1 glutamine amidotransferase [Temperatibacter marinus]|uniref:Type 1 glutamine amidotransferase n=1 Tax=Temperatibacter marinus TaxID=1456591 RepID=A0AA52HBM0_9PROT|nr:type 1 glutamine amidotransferase [Temperatibacter marinus]WND03890.1 type 1 glutamine amidotransferase [Temperatibacter marinus]
MKIAILQCGESIESAIDLFGDYDEMCKTMLGLSPSEATSYRIFDHHFPEISAYDAFVITGSKYGVYENHSWIPPLEEKIRGMNAARKKVIGICFGHQIIAQALGGKVRKDEKGFGVGLMTYQMKIDNEMREISLYAWHQDQVYSLPKDAHVIAHSDFCPYAGLQYGTHILTFQAHPEFLIGYEKALLEERRGVTISTQLADQALTSLSKPSHSKSVCRHIQNFVQDAL